jgi:hypothetical protein
MWDAFRNKPMNDVKIQFFSGGYSTHREAIVVSGGRWKSIAFPAVFAVITHPKIGIILYGTGYSARFFEETRNFPARLYALITPVFYEARDSAAGQNRKIIFHSYEPVTQNHIKLRRIKRTFSLENC